MIQQPNPQQQVQRRRTNSQAKPGTEADKTAKDTQEGQRLAKRPETSREASREARGRQTGHRKARGTLDKKTEQQETSDVRAHSPPDLPTTAGVAALAADGWINCRQAA